VVPDDARPPCGRAVTSSWGSKDRHCNTPDNCRGHHATVDSSKNKEQSLTPRVRLALNLIEICTPLILERLSMRNPRRKRTIRVVEKLESRVCLSGGINSSPMGQLVASQLSQAAYVPFAEYQNGAAPALPAGWVVDTADGGPSPDGNNQVVVFVNSSTYQVGIACKGSDNVSNFTSDITDYGASAYASIMPVANNETPH